MIHWPNQSGFVSDHLYKESSPRKVLSCSKSKSFLLGLDNIQGCILLFCESANRSAVLLVVASDGACRYRQAKWVEHCSDRIWIVAQVDDGMEAGKEAFETHLWFRHWSFALHSADRHSIKMARLTQSVCRPHCSESGLPGMHQRESSRKPLPSSVATRLHSGSALFR